MNFSPTLTVQLTTLLCIVYPLFVRLILCFVQRGRIKNTGLLLLSLIALLIPIFLDSRSGILSVVVAIIVMLGHSNLLYHRKRLLLTSLGISLALLTSILYAVRPDAANGRLLVYQVMFMAILQQPLSGYGWQAFHKMYMVHQAEYFKLHPDSQFALLADNVYFPYNEFLGVAYRYGIPVLLIFLILLVLLWKWSAQYGRASLAAFCTMCMFSYPISSFIPQKEMIEGLYEEAATLNEQEKYAESDSILKNCQQYLNNYDTELLAADNALQQKKYDTALKHLELASNMVPCRFYPLYGKMLAYQQRAPTKADSVARVILQKQVKIPSSDIEFIKQEAKLQLLE